MKLPTQEQQAKVDRIISEEVERFVAAEMHKGNISDHAEGIEESLKLAIARMVLKIILEFSAP